MVVVLQRRVPPVVGVLLVLTLVLSLVAAIHGGLYRTFALVPADVWDGELWRLVTWIFVELGPMTLIAVCVTLFWCGSDLERGWGTTYFAQRVVGLVVVVAGATMLAAFAMDVWWWPYFGGHAVACALIIAWALQYPDRQVLVFWVLIVGGRTLARGTVLYVLLLAAFFGIVAMLPDLFACAAAMLYMHGTHIRLARAVRRAFARRPLRVVN